MSNRKVYRVKLSADERCELEAVSKGKRGQLKIAAWKVQRAKAMLLCDEGDEGPAWQDQDVAEAVGTTTRSLENWRKHAVAHGPLSVLERQKRTSTKAPIVDGEVEAKLTQIACSEPIDGKSKWSLRMLADRLVELEIVDSISYETVRRTMKKTF
ncbi:MAG: helix-turn-helix domain-containing protein [Planctomycetales bacterium]|nr:helix-turn-helix domain-containing protein [Planctomycetales bacterium]